MKKQTIIIGTILALSAAAPATALARAGFATTDVHLRAGPSTDLPIVGTIDRGDRLDIHGCLDSYNWCDVTWRGERGWVYSTYLRLAWHHRRVRLPRFAARIDLPVISFSFGDYWDRHYRHRNWHHRRDYWRGRWVRHHQDRDDRRREHDRADRDHHRVRDHNRDARRGGHDRDRGRTVGQGDGGHDRRAGDRDHDRNQRHRRRDDAAGLRFQIGPGGVDIR